MFTCIVIGRIVVIKKREFGEKKFVKDKNRKE